MYEITRSNQIITALASKKGKWGKVFVERKRNSPSYMLKSSYNLNKRQYNPCEDVKIKNKHREKKIHSQSIPLFAIPHTRLFFPSTFFRHKLFFSLFLQIALYTLTHLAFYAYLLVLKRFPSNCCFIKYHVQSALRICSSAPTDSTDPR